MTRRRMIAPALLLAAVSTACSLKVPATSTWTLPGVSDPARWAADGPVLGVADVAAGSEVLSTAMTWRTGGGREIHRHPTAEWADYPDRLIEDLLVRRLAASGEFSHVRSVPPRGDVDAVLACTVRDFSEWDGPGTGEGRVSLRCELRSPEGDVIAPLEALGRAATEQASLRGMATSLGDAALSAVDSIVGGAVAALDSREPGPDA